MTTSYANTLPQDIASAFPGITLQQYRLLCFVAFRGEWPADTWSRDKYDGKFGLPKGRTAADRKKLTEMGLLTGGDTIPNQNYFRTVVPMLKTYPQWAAAFEDLGKYRNDRYRWLWQVALCIAAGDLEPARKLSYPTNERIWMYFLPILFSKEYGPVLTILSQPDKEALLDTVLDGALSFDNLSPTILDRVTNMALSSLLHPERVISHAQGMRYLVTGEPVGTEYAGTRWGLAVEGIRHLYGGRLSDALDAFLGALAVTDGAKSRKSFESPLLNWFYGICLMRCCKTLRSHKARKALDDLRAESSFKFSDRNAAARILLTYMDVTSKQCPEHIAEEIDRIDNEARTKLCSYLCQITARYFRMDDGRLAGLWVGSQLTPSTPVLRNEMSAVMPMSSSEKASLKETFGGTGTLSALPRKEGWEMSLSELTDVVRDCQEDGQTERRIIYFLNDNWLTAIIEQSRRPGEEEWSGERLLSRDTFVKSGYDSMDITDMKVAAALGRKMIDIPDKDVVIPLLAGSGRIFTGQHYSRPYTPLVIEEERPFIAFTGRNGGIAVSSNVSRRADGSIPASQTVNAGGRFVFIRTNPVQRDILSKILAIGLFPASAAPAIRNTISSLEGVIDVRSELGSAAVIPTMRGSTRLALRITPGKDEDDGYIVDIQTAPDEDGPLRCEPGRGEDNIYDDTGADARFISRDLQQEYDNYLELRSYLEGEAGLEFETDTRVQIAASVSLLKLLVWAYENGDRCFTEWPEGRPLRFRGDVKSGDFDITVSSGIDWFAVEGDVNIGRDKYNLRDILEAMKASDVDGFIKLGDKDYIRMSKAIQKHLAALDEMMNQKVGKDRVVPVYRVGQLAQVLGEEGGLHGTMDKGFKDLLGRMQNAYDTVPELPEGLNATLRDYQKEGYIWMKRLDAWGAGACLADDMGLGKTLQSLAFILSKASEGPSLVVAPKSIIPNWDIEAAKFTPSLRVIVLNNENKRQDVINAAGPNDLVLATYGVLGTEAKALASREWNVVCLDEAHQIKNRNTRISAAAMGLHARSRLILTGTPIQNHLGELWNLFQFINPGLLGQWSEFKSRYMGTAALDDENKSFLKDLVQPFILRRTKEEVLDDLPEKIVYEQMVELSPEELQVYEATRKYVEDRMNDPGKKGKAKTSDDHVPIQFFAELTKLRLAACSMSLVYDDWKGCSSKTEALKGILEELSGSEGNRVLIFSQFTSYLAQIRAMLDKAGMRYLYLDGQTELDERAELVEQFQNGDCPIFLVSLKAGGLGLNLTAANYVILLDPWWNPAIENQAMDRAHRIGQKRNVTVIRLIAQHTIEEKILHLHEKKQTLTDEMLDGTADSYHLTMDDVLDMVSPFR